MYSIAAIIGFAVALLYIWHTNQGGRAGHLNNDDLWNLFGVVVIGIFVGGRGLGMLVDIPLVIRHWAAISDSWYRVLTMLFSSFVFYGGFIGAVAAVGWYCKKYSVPFDDAAGLLVPAVPLFHSFARVGCFMAGCCWGVESAHGIVFTRSDVAPLGVPLLPVQLYESAFNLLLFFILALISRRIRTRISLLPLYCTLYGTGRFFLEFYRGDAHRGIFFGLSTSQWISLVLLALSAWFFLHRRKMTPDTAAG